VRSPLKIRPKTGVNREQNQAGLRGKRRTLSRCSGKAKVLGASSPRAIPFFSFLWVLQCTLGDGLEAIFHFFFFFFFFSSLRVRARGHGDVRMACWTRANAARIHLGETTILSCCPGTLGAEPIDTAAPLLKPMGRCDHEGPARTWQGFPPRRYSSLYSSCGCAFFAARDLCQRGPQTMQASRSCRCSEVRRPPAGPLFFEVA